MKFFAVAILVLSLFSIHCLVSAEQLSFKKTIVNDAVKFRYQWHDQKQEKQSLQFTIDKRLIFNQFRNFKAYKPILAKKYISHGLKKALDEKPLPDVRTFYSGIGKKAKIELESENPEALNTAYQTVEKIEKELQQQYLYDHYYQQYLNYDGNLAVKPDHTRFANESVSDFTPFKEPVIKKLTDKSIRNITNYLLGFIQSIPYATLESRVTSSGAGFNPPLRALWENQGDCDSKVTLMAAMLRALEPTAKILLIFIDNHALLAIDIPAHSGELTIQVENINYILAEPTGPAMMLAGNISPDSEFAIRNGRYVAEAFIPITLQNAVSELSKGN